MKQIAPFIVMIVVLIIIAIVIIAAFNYRLKKQILDSGPVDENSLKFLTHLSSPGSEVLKWGIILFFGGVGLVVLEFIPYKRDSPLPYGLEAIFISLGFLLYYLWIRNGRKNSNK